MRKYPSGLVAGGVFHFLPTELAFLPTTRLHSQQRQNLDDAELIDGMLLTAPADGMIGIASVGQQTVLWGPGANPGAMVQADYGRDCTPLTDWPQGLRVKWKSP